MKEEKKILDEADEEKIFRETMQFLYARAYGC